MIFLINNHLIIIADFQLALDKAADTLGGSRGDVVLIVWALRTINCLEIPYLERVIVGWTEAECGIEKGEDLGQVSKGKCTVRGEKGV